MEGQQIVQPLYSVKGWMKFIGILNMIAGVIYCITIIGAIVGWIPLWIGICMNKAATRIGDGISMNNDQMTYEGVDSLATAIKIIGILMLIGIIINVVMVGFMVLALVGGMAAAAGAR